MHTRRFPPPWSAKLLAVGVLHDERCADIFNCLFRGGARPAISGEVADEGRGQAVSGEHRQAAGVADESHANALLKWSQYKISNTKLSISMIAATPATESAKASFTSW